MTAARLRIVLRRGDGTASPLRKYFIASIVGHLLLVSGAMWLPGLRATSKVPDTFPIIELVADLPAPPAARAQPAPAKPAPPTEGARVETREPPKPTPIPKKPAEKPKPKPAEPEPVRTRQSPPAETAQPDPGEATGTVGGTEEDADPGANLTSVFGGGSALAWYGDSVKAAIRRQWRRPILTGMREVRQVRVGFDILRNGQVSGLSILEPSGVSVLDRSALRAISDAAPLPPLPQSWREPTMSAVLAFELLPEQ